MAALSQAGVATHTPQYCGWARDLVLAAHRAFVYTRPDGSKAMYWKMSTDLSRPQVGSFSALGRVVSLVVMGRMH